MLYTKIEEIRHKLQLKMDKASLFVNLKNNLLLLPWTLQPRDILQLICGDHVALFHDPCMSLVHPHLHSPLNTLA